MLPQCAGQDISATKQLPLTAIEVTRVGCRTAQGRAKASKSRPHMSMAVESGIMVLTPLCLGLRDPPRAGMLVGKTSVRVAFAGLGGAGGGTDAAPFCNEEALDWG